MFATFLPNDNSDAAVAARQIKDLGEFDQLRFMVRVGVEPPQGPYEAKNTIKDVIRPNEPEWKKLDQIDRDLLGGAVAQSSATAQTATQPASAIARPNWAKD